jgi:phosphonate transport system substrate-binding protein
MIKCPKCENEAFHKNGFVLDKQRYRCKLCDHQFTSNEDKTQHKVIARQLYLSGFSMRKIGKLLDTSPQSAMRWIKEYEDKNSAPKYDNCQLKIGIVPAQIGQDMLQGIDLLKRELSNNLSTRVGVGIFPSYIDVVEALHYGAIDIAYMGPLTYTLSKFRSNTEALMTSIVNDDPCYESVIITSSDSHLDSIEDVIKDSKNLGIAFTNLHSTSGYLIPSNMLIKAGVFRSIYDHDFKKAEFALTHDMVATMVQQNQIHIGALDSVRLKGFIDNKIINPDKIRIIWRSEKLFQYPWVVNSQISSSTKDKLREVFFNIKDENILKAFGNADKFVPANNADYDVIGAMAKQRRIV